MKTLSMLSLCRAALATLVVGISAAAANAAIMVLQPTAVTNTVECCGRTGTMAINGSGLSDATIVQTGDPIPAPWPSHLASGGGDMYLSNSIEPATITFDLGQFYKDVAGFHVWNYNEDSGNPSFYVLRGMRNVTVDFSTASALGPFTNAIVYTGGTQFQQATGLSTYMGEDKLFPQINTRYIRFVGDNWGGENYTGLSEVRFFTADAVPEPSTLTLLGLGIAALAIRTRRNRRAAA